MLAAVRALNRVELVVETMRHALDTLASLAPDFLQRWLGAHRETEQTQDWVLRYSHRAEDNQWHGLPCQASPPKRRNAKPSWKQ